MTGLGSAWFARPMNGPYPLSRAVEILLPGSGFVVQSATGLAPGWPAASVIFGLAFRASHRVVVEVDPATPALSVSKWLRERIKKAAQLTT